MIIYQSEYRVKREGKQEEGPSPNEEKFIIDNQGKYRLETKSIIPKDRVTMDIGGKIIKPEDIKPQIYLFDGKYQWVYSPALNAYAKREVFPSRGARLVNFFKSFLICTNDLLKESLPYLENITLEEGKFNGKKAKLIVLSFPGQERRFWVDASNYLPLGSELITYERGKVFVERRIIKKIEINQKLPRKCLNFTPPQGSKQVSLKAFFEEPLR